MRFKEEQVLVVKKDGQFYTAKVKAIGPRSYIDECLVDLSMQCHNLQPNEEPEIIFPKYASPGTLQNFPSCDQNVSTTAQNNAAVLTGSVLSNITLASNSVESNNAPIAAVGPSDYFPVESQTVTEAPLKKRKGLIHPHEVVSVNSQANATRQDSSNETPQNVYVAVPIEVKYESLKKTRRSYISLTKFFVTGV